MQEHLSGGATEAVHDRKCTAHLFLLQGTCELWAKVRVDRQFHSGPVLPISGHSISLSMQLSFHRFEKVGTSDGHLER